MADTIIGKNIIIDGEISGDQPVSVSGKVKGAVNLNSAFHVAEGGYVEAEIDTKTMHVDGNFTGNVNAHEKIEIRQTGKMIGDIKAPRIHIADGAAFKGHIDMDVE